MYAVELLYHPTLHVPSLDDADDFYRRVFGRPSTRLTVIMPTPPVPGHSNDHSTFTLIGDVFLDSLDPQLYLTGGTRRYHDVELGRMTNPGGWYVEGVKELYLRLREAGFRLVNARDELLDEPAWPGGMAPFYSHPDDAGLKYAFFETFPFPFDVRLQPGWVLPEIEDDDPLGVRFAAYHTILTARPERALSLLVDVLGGEVLSTGRDDLRGVSGPYVRLADAIFHLATPDPGSDLAADPVHDTYHAITWRVADLEKAAKHLQAEGVRIQQQSETTLVTDPATSLGVPWGFTTAAINGDMR
jgi:catechol 2,3-dioxygenase-like lactoylglutathione lyase family enzyme